MKGLIVFTFLGLFIFSIASRSQDYQEKTRIEYVEIKGKKGPAMLHTGMVKDSVEILVGKPENVRLNTIANSTFETWEYKIADKYYPDLEIKFQDGQLTGVTER